MRSAAFTRRPLVYVVCLCTPRRTGTLTWRRRANPIIATTDMVAIFVSSTRRTPERLIAKNIAASEGTRTSVLRSMRYKRPVSVLAKG